MIRLRVLDYLKNLEHPFGLARSTRSESPSVLIEHGGCWGEAAPSGGYGETAEQTHANLSMELPEFPEATQNPAPYLEDLARGPLGKNRSALAAVDMLLHDRWGKAVNQPVWKLLGSDRTKMPISSFTIGIADLDEMIRKVETVGQRSSILKIKMGRNPQSDTEMIAAIHRAAPQKTLRVDANEGWDLENAKRVASKIDEMGSVDLIEQPFPRSDTAASAALSRHARTPVFLDENCHFGSDVAVLAPHCRGVNAKLMKTGGLFEAVKIIHEARAHRIGLMLGCMIETSLGITAAAQIAPQFDFIDLDGHVLINNDPFEGAGWDQGRLTLSDRPGLGVTLREPSLLAF